MEINVGKILKTATETVKGVVELATTAEVLAGVDTERAITPATLKKGQANGVPSLDATGKVPTSQLPAIAPDFATQAEVNTGEMQNKVVSPYTLKGYMEELGVLRDVIGVELVTSGTGPGVWRRVDVDGNTLYLTMGNDFNSHPVYKNITPVVIDGQDMVRIPKFHVLNVTVDGKERTYIGSTQFSVNGATSAVHKAFIVNGVEKEFFYIGAYEAGYTSSKATSLYGQTVMVTVDFPTMVSRCKARNTGGVTGFDLVNIYQIGAIQCLCLVEMGAADSQAIIGNGHYSGSACVATGASNAVWRGIHELWANSWCMTRGLENRSMKYYIWTDAGNETFVSTGLAVPTGSNSPIASVYKNEIFKGLFLPLAVGSGSYSDNFWSANGTMVCYHGGCWGNGAAAGLFCLGLGAPASYSSADVGGRLARVG